MKLWSSLWQGWKKLALKLAKLQTLILLTLFYFTIFAFYALILRLFQKDLLDKKWKRGRSFWINKPRYKVDLESAKRQF